MTDNSITLKIPGTDVIVGSPVDNFRVVPGGTFENERMGKNGETYQHQSLDQAPPTPNVPGEPVHAAVGGTIVYAGETKGFGYHVLVETPLGGDKYLYTNYNHLIEPDDKGASLIGKGVSPGTLIGKEGNSGACAAWMGWITPSASIRPTC